MKTLQDFYDANKTAVLIVAGLIAAFVIYKKTIK